MRSSDSSPDYKAPLWLPGGHAQTIVPALFAERPQVAFRRERWPAPDGDFVDVDFMDGHPGTPMLVLFHGLEGSSGSHYARALMAAAGRLGWRGAVPHFRSCSGEMNAGPRFYHSGDHEEVDWIVRKIAALVRGDQQREVDDHQQQEPAEKRAAQGDCKIFLVGASLGGSVLLNWLGRSQHDADFVTAACAVCAPLDLIVCGHNINRGINRVYERAFLRTLKPKAVQKLAQFPGLFKLEDLQRCNTMWAFDNVVTAPLHGFNGADHYWETSSASRVLNDITVPALVLNPQNDPFLPACHLPRTASASVVLEFPRHGGHLGFTAGPLNRRTTWLPGRVLEFFSQF